MNYKIKFVTIEKFLFVILLITDVCFFTLPYISNYFISVCTYHNKRLSLAVVLLMFIFAFFDGLMYKIGNLKSNKYLLGFTLLVSVTFLISVVKYRSLNSIFGYYYYYAIYILLVLVLKYYSDRYNYFSDFIINAVLVVGLIYLIYSVLSYFAFDTNKLIIMNSEIQLYAFRNGHVRLVRITDYISLAILLAMIRFFDSNKKIKYFIYTIIGLFAIFFICQTRIYQIALIVVLLFLLLKHTKGLINKILMFLGLLVVFYLLADSIKDFINSFDELSYSTENRLSAYSYYSKHFFDNLLIGLGFVTGSINYNLLHGPMGEFFISDCGYIGFLSVFGLCGLIFLIIYLGHLLKESTSSFFHFNHKNDYMICGLVLYFLITNWSVSITDPQRCVVGSIMVALIEISLTNKNNFRKRLGGN